MSGEFTCLGEDIEERRFPDVWKSCGRLDRVIDEKTRMRTDNTNLEVVAGTAKKDFLLLNLCLFRWHPFLYRAEG